MTKHFLDFEKPIADLEGKIEELRHMSSEGAAALNIDDEVERLQDKLEKNVANIYAKLAPWQKVQVARHPERPRCKDYITALIEDFTPLAGDRVFGEDQAIISGFGRFKGNNVMVMGHERGGTTESRLKHNFGMANPEGYRKAIRLMDLADRFSLPVLFFVDTPGAYPGLGAEERGQAEAIAKSIEKCVRLRVPIISTITGEGGSGGAIAIATANSILMLENSVYSVISPEGCASILWRSATKAKEASEALRITAQDLEEFGVIDAIIDEPLGGAHRAPDQAIQAVGEEIEGQLKVLLKLSADQLKAHRADKFLAMGRRAA